MQKKNKFTKDGVDDKLASIFGCILKNEKKKHRVELEYSQGKINFILDIFNDSSIAQ